jgi:hypothetical protein
MQAHSRKAQSFDFFFSHENHARFPRDFTHKNAKSQPEGWLFDLNKTEASSASY